MPKQGTNPIIYLDGNWTAGICEQPGWNCTVLIRFYMYRKQHMSCFREEKTQLHERERKGWLLAYIFHWNIRDQNSHQELTAKHFWLKTGTEISRENDYLVQAGLFTVKVASLTEANRDKLLYNHWELETVKKPNHWITW